MLYVKYILYIYIEIINKPLKLQIMTNITFSTGSKKVNILRDATGVYRAFYVQVYNGQEQVLEAKCYSSYIMAQKWANKKLN